MSEKQPSMSLEAMVIFEFGLAALALLIGWMVRFDPLQSIERGPDALLGNVLDLAIGAALAVPVLAFFVSLDRWAGELMKPIQKVLFETIVPAMVQGGWPGRAVVSLGAGVGEEILFRGLVQDGLSNVWGVIPALIFASVLFGVVHWVNITYFIFATGIGLALGLVFLWTDGLVAPIAMHAVYDFLALDRLVKDHESDKQTQEAIGPVDEGSNVADGQDAGGAADDARSTAGRDADGPDTE